MILLLQQVSFSLKKTFEKILPDNIRASLHRKSMLKKKYRKLVCLSNRKNPLSERALAFTKNCRDDRIRTCGPYVPNVVRYRAALHPVTAVLANVRLRINSTKSEIVPESGIHSCPGIDPGSGTAVFEYRKRGANKP